jgi:hypothetical protein
MYGEVVDAEALSLSHRFRFLCLLRFSKPVPMIATDGVVPFLARDGAQLPSVALEPLLLRLVSIPELDAHELFVE